MEKDNENIYFADYLDYSIEKRGRNISSPYEQLIFDLLCFYPARTVLTLTSTLIGEASTRFIEFHDFWKNGALKVHLSKGDTADKYLSRKLASSSGYVEDNYEMKLYSSEKAAHFVKKYLKAELTDQNIDYVLPRTTNADQNNRESVLDNLAINERAIIEAPGFSMTLSEFDQFAYRLQNLADDTSFIFQRSHIIHDLVEHRIFKDASLISPVILSTLDTSYNQAMAKSINATIISTMSSQLNGVGLRNFIKGYSPKLYGLIISMSPAKIFLLVQDKNWQIFRDYISKLYISLLSSENIIRQDTAFYKKTVRSERRSQLIEFCLDEMESVVFDAIKYANPGAWVYVNDAKIQVSNYINYWRKKFSKEDEYYSEEIIKRTKLVELICEDILHGIYK